MAVSQLYIDYEWWFHVDNLEQIYWEELHIKRYVLKAVVVGFLGITASVEGIDQLRGHIWLQWFHCRTSTLLGTLAWTRSAAFFSEATSKSSSIVHACHCNEVNKYSFFMAVVTFNITSEFPLHYLRIMIPVVGSLRINGIYMCRHCWTILWLTCWSIDYMEPPVKDNIRHFRNADNGRRLKNDKLRRNSFIHFFLCEFTKEMEDPNLIRHSDNVFGILWSSLTANDPPMKYSASVTQFTSNITTKNNHEPFYLFLFAKQYLALTTLSLAASMRIWLSWSE